jgi:signal transduction histidine kinase
VTVARRAGSLRVRLLAATLAALAVALVLAGFALQGLFRDHVMRQLEAGLRVHLDQLTARLDFDPDGRPRIDERAMSDPRWERPLSGLYWQLDELRDDGVRAGVLRSRSLWDQVLRVPEGGTAAADLRAHDLRGPGDRPLVLLERTVQGETGVRWRLAVAGDAQVAADAVTRFTGVLVASLAVLGALLGLAAVAQVVVGLSPLHAMQRALVAVREGRSARLQGRFPAEVQPLIDEFNRVLDRNAEVIERARTQAGNLAHAIRTPLAVLAQTADAAARRPGADPQLVALARRVAEQVEVSRRHVDRQLARARAAATPHAPGARTPVVPVVAGLARVMARVHAERGIAFERPPGGEALAFAGDEHDLHEMLGNLLDNAFKWARSTVRVRIEPLPDRPRPCLRVTVDDDGPGLAPEVRDAVRARGVRADESVPGSGLGLAIVDELVQACGGTLELGAATLGGLSASLVLPAVAPG